MLNPQRKSLILNAPYPLMKKQLRGFLRKTRFCQIWTPGYGKQSRTLYEKLRGKKDEPLVWDEICKIAFNALKELITIAPALGLPNLEKPFRL